MIELDELRAVYDLLDEDEFLGYPALVAMLDLPQRRIAAALQQLRKMGLADWTGSAWVLTEREPAWEVSA